MKILNKNILAIKIIGILFLVLSLSLAPIPGRKASAWIDTVIPKIILPPMQMLLDQLMVMITGTAKQAAVKMITQNVYGAVGGGSSGGAKFILNWSSALTANPKKEAALYIEQLSKNSTRMKGSSFYQSTSASTVGTQFEGVGKEGLAQYFQSPRFIDSVNAQEDFGNSTENYAADLGEIVSSIADENSCAITYEGNLVDNLNAEDITNEAYAEEINNFLSGNNDKASYETCFENVYDEKLAEAKAVAEAKAIAYGGFEGTEKDGNTIYPGSLIKEKMANIENMGNEVIANAQGIAEVIASSVMKMGMDAMNNGIGNVQAQIQKGVTNVSTKAQSQMQNQVKNYGPGAMYGN